MQFEQKVTLRHLHIGLKKKLYEYEYGKEKSLHTKSSDIIFFICVNTFNDYYVKSSFYITDLVCEEMSESKYPVNQGEDKEECQNSLCGYLFADSK